MTRSLHRVSTFARREARLVMRGWVFRVAVAIPAAIFTVLFVTGIFGFNVKLQISLFVSGLPSTLPYLACSFFTIYLTVAAILISVRSLGRDESLDSFEAVSSRPWSNGEYVAGKALGVFVPMLVIMVLVMAASAGVGLTMKEVSLDPLLFVLYPALLWLPAFIAAAGVSFIAGRLLRSPALALPAALAVPVLSALAAGRAGHLFDLTGFRLPLFHSSMTGIPGIGEILLQRAAWAAAGLGLLALTAALLPRPEGKGRERVSGSAVSVLLIALALSAGIYRAELLAEGPRMRERMRETGREAGDWPMVDPVSYEIKGSWDREALDLRARVVLENGSSEPVDRYVFSLNPGFEISSVTSAGEAVTWEREIHLLSVYPGEPLEPGRIDSFTVDYSGLADGRAMYAGVPEASREEYFDAFEVFGWLREFTLLRNIFGMVRFGREFAPASGECVVLVPEAMWYPVAGIPFDPGIPGSGEPPFARYYLQIMLPDGWEAVSPGELTQFRQDREYEFVPRRPLKGMSLAIGRYDLRSIQVDGISYTTCLTPQSDRVLDFFEQAADSLPGLIRMYRGMIETSLDMTFPYDRVRIAEVPAGFLPQLHPASGPRSGLVRPEIVLVGERGAWTGIGGELYLHSFFDITGGGGGSFNAVAFTLKNLIANFAGNSLYSIEPMYVDHCVDIARGEGRFGLALEYFFSSRVAGFTYCSIPSGSGIGLSERLSELLAGGGIERILDDPERSDCAANYLHKWSEYLVYYLEAVLEGFDVRSALAREVASHRFAVLDPDELLGRLAAEAGAGDIELPDFDGETRLPGYVCSDPVICRFIEDERERWRIDMQVRNPEPAGGVIAVYVWQKNSRPRGGAMMFEPEEVFLVEGGKTKDISLAVDHEPFKVAVNTLISRNVPANMAWAIFSGDLEIEEECMRGSVPPRIAHPAPGEIIVDDRDPGFSRIERSSSPIRGLLGLGEDEDDGPYDTRMIRRIPGRWIEVVGDAFHGRYYRSAVSISAGDGEARALFEAEIHTPGRYEVFFHVHDPYRTQRMSTDEHDRIQYHIHVGHSGGTEEVVLPLVETTEGWNSLGTFYFGEGRASVTLTDESPAGWVIADAARWSPVE